MSSAKKAVIFFGYAVLVCMYVQNETKLGIFQNVWLHNKSHIQTKQLSNK